MNQNIGAHELLEMHEVLENAIDGINQFELLRPHAKDVQLVQMIDRQLQFMTNEYNSMVNLLHSKGLNQAIPQRTPLSYQAQEHGTPKYGLRQPAPEAPKTSVSQLSDRDVSSEMLGCKKAAASLRMHAALECADPALRQMMIQGAMNCAEMAYEVWSYMNQKGYYQVPTLKDMTTQTMINVYQPMNTGTATMQTATMQTGSYSAQMGYNNIQ